MRSFQLRHCTKTALLCALVLATLAIQSQTLAAEKTDDKIIGYNTIQIWPVPDQLVERFELNAGGPVLEHVGAGDIYVEALGEQAGMWGRMGDSLEAWAYPFKLVGGLTFEFSVDGGKTYSHGSDLVKAHRARPYSADMEFAGEGFAVTQTLFVPRNQPGVSILLDVDSSVDLTVAVNFKVSLAPMLLDTKEKPQVRWDNKTRTLRAVERERKVELLVWSPAATRHETMAAGNERLILTIPAETAKKGLVPIIMAGSWEGQASADKTVSVMASRMRHLYEQAAGHYREILDGAPVVDSPDKHLNDALSWSIVSLDQLRVKNPFLGYGLVSGYSPSRGGTRPCYAWFFDEPTLTSWAYLRAGLARHVTEAFEFLLRYQRHDGKMVHEVTQSLPYHQDYFDKYMYAYIHASSGTYFLAACGNYYRQTGDLDFIRRNWTKLEKMLDWCTRAVDPEDGLLRIGEKQWGSSESSFEVGKDTQMEGMWLRALREMAYLAEAIGDNDLAAQCNQMARKASRSIEQKFWDEEMSSYIWGLDRADRPLKSLVPHHSVSVWMGSLRPDRVTRMLERMAYADVRSDWGVRSLPATDKRYNPEGYQTGSVWPVWNAGIIIGDYRHGRQIDAFRNLLSMAQVRTIQVLGPMPEVLDGRHCKLLEKSVRHQMFCEIAVQNAFYEGLLGLHVDIPASTLALSPHIPATWQDLSAKMIPVGPGRLDLQIKNSPQHYELTFDLRTANEFSVHLAPLLGAGCSIDKVLLDNKIVKAKTLRTGSGTVVQLDLARCKGKHTLVIKCTGGFDFMCEDTPLSLGKESGNLRLIKTEFKDNVWNLLVEGLPQTVYPLRFRTSRKPDTVIGGGLLDTSNGFVRVGLTSPPKSEKSYGNFVRWRAQIGWRR